MFLSPITKSAPNNVRPPWPRVGSTALKTKEGETHSMHQSWTSMDSRGHSGGGSLSPASSHFLVRDLKTECRRSNIRGLVLITCKSRWEVSYAITRDLQGPIIHMGSTRPRIAGISIHEKLFVSIN